MSTALRTVRNHFINVGLGRPSSLSLGTAQKMIEKSNPGPDGWMLVNGPADAHRTMSIAAAERLVAENMNREKMVIGAHSALDPASNFLRKCANDPTHKDTRFPASAIGSLGSEVALNDVCYKVAKKKRGDVYTVSLVPMTIQEELIMK